MQYREVEFLEIPSERLDRYIRNMLKVDNIKVLFLYDLEEIRQFYNKHPIYRQNQQERLHERIEMRNMIESIRHRNRLRLAFLEDLLCRAPPEEVVNGRDAALGRESSDIGRWINSLDLRPEVAESTEERANITTDVNDEIALTYPGSSSDVFCHIDKMLNSDPGIRRIVAIIILLVARFGRHDIAVHAMATIATE